jgi:predicted nucleotidyltransferase
MKTIEEIKNVLRENKDIIEKDYKAEIIGIFGSYARGEQKAQSDVDILVRFKDEATLFDFVGLAEFLEEKLGIKVDILTINAVKQKRMLWESIKEDLIYV